MSEREDGVPQWVCDESDCELLVEARGLGATNHELETRRRAEIYVNARNLLFATLQQEGGEPPCVCDKSDHELIAVARAFHAPKLEHITRERAELYVNAKRALADHVKRVQYAGLADEAPTDDQEIDYVAQDIHKLFHWIALSAAEMFCVRNSKKLD